MSDVTCEQWTCDDCDTVNDTPEGLQPGDIVFCGGCDGTAVIM